MGWNDHDDRLMDIADILEDAGMAYVPAYELALEIRTDEMRGADMLSEDALMQMALDAMEMDN